jgi:hypothetical protein
MLAFADVGQIIVGDSFYNNVISHDTSSKEFKEIEVSPSEWSYIDEKTGSRYRIHLNVL